VSDTSTIEKFCGRKRLRRTRSRFRFSGRKASRRISSKPGDEAEARTKQTAALSANTERNSRRDCAWRLQEATATAAFLRRQANQSVSRFRCHRRPKVRLAYASVSAGRTRFLSTIRALMGCAPRAATHSAMSIVSSFPRARAVARAARASYRSTACRCARKINTRGFHCCALPR